MEIIKRYINPQNIDLIFKLYGFETPVNVHYHYEIKKQYFLDYIKRSKIFEDDKRTEPDGTNNEYFTMTELRTYLPEGKNVNFWANYKDFLESLKFQKYFNTLKDINVFKVKYSNMSEIKIIDFCDFLRNNPRWNYEEHLIYLIEKIRQERNVDSNILKLYENCMLGGNYRGLMILLNNCDLMEKYEEEILDYASASWDANIFKILYQKYKINYLKDLSPRNINALFYNYRRYNSRFLLTLLKYNEESNGFEDLFDDILQSIFNNTGISDYKLLTVDILKTMLKGYDLYYDSDLSKEDLLVFVSEHPSFNFLLEMMDPLKKGIVFKPINYRENIFQHHQNMIHKRFEMIKNQQINNKTLPIKEEPRKNVSYSAVILDENSKDKILSYFDSIIPNGWKKFGHHMTIKMGSLENKQELGKQVVLEVVGIGKSEMAIAAQVKGYPTMNKIPHITLAININEGGKPVMSNFITDWEPISLPFQLTGIVSEV